MSSELSLLLKLINEDKSLNEISNILDMNNKELFKQITLLKKSSMFFNKEYCYDGNIYYNQVKSKKDLYKDYVLYTEKNQNILNMIVLSDLHLCSEYQRLDLLNELYNYAIKNNINIILNCGDLVDGLIGKNNKMDSRKQIDYLINKYPFDENIINFICLGNHDESLLVKDKIDIAYYLECQRQDLVTLGFGTGILNIKNDQIIMKHPETNGYKTNDIYENKLILKGHSHFMKYINLSGNNVLFVPSLSDISIADKDLLPSFIQMNLKIEDGLFSYVDFTQLVWNNNKFVKINTIETDLSYGKSFKKNNGIKNEIRLIKKYK